MIGAFALSEPDAGTDAANQKTTATRTANGYRIKGKKVWVANAEEAAVAIVFACTRPGLRGQGVTAFLVPMTAPGITRTARADSLGVRGLGCMDLELDIEVADDQVLGHVDQGFRLAMWALQGGRVAIAAQALGIGEAAISEAIAYAKQREQFGQPIANYQAIQWMLADMATELDAARMLTFKAAAAKDGQEKSATEASMAKLAASEAAHRAADKAMQILASAGYRRGSVVERLFRDVRATEIYQGTSEAQRMIIAASVLAKVASDIGGLSMSETEPSSIRSGDNGGRRRGIEAAVWPGADGDDAEKRQAAGRRLEQRQSIQERRRQDLRRDGVCDDHLGV